MGDAIRNLIRNKVVMAVVSIIIGILLMVMGSSFIAAVIKILGVVLLIAAAVYIIMYLVGGSEGRSSSQIIAGVICAVVGLLFLLIPQFFVNIFPFIMGIVLVVSGIMDLAQIFSNFVGTPGARFLQILAAVLVIVLGVVCIVQPGAIADFLTVFIGLALLVNGIFDLVILFAHREI